MFEQLLTNHWFPDAFWWNMPIDELGKFANLEVKSIADRAQKELNRRNQQITWRLFDLPQRPAQIHGR